MESNVKNVFSRKSFLMTFDVDFPRFQGLERRFSGFLGLGSRFEKDGFLVMQTDPSKWKWRGGSTSDLDPEKHLTAQPYS